MRRLAAGAACLALALAWTTHAKFRAACAASGKTGLSGYSGFGETLAHGIRARAPLVSYRMPLATLVAARLDYHSPTTYEAALAATTGLCVLLLFAVGALLHPDGDLVAALAVVVLPRMWYLWLFPEVAYCFLVLLSAGLLVWRARAPSAGRSLLFAASVGASLLWRSPLAFFAPALALYEWAFEPRVPPKARRAQLLILCVVPYLFLLPWIAMNWSIHRRIVPFEHRAAEMNIVTGALGLVQTTEGDVSKLLDGRSGTEKGASVLGWAVRESLRHPLRSARAYALRLKFVLGLHPLLALLAAAGLWTFRARREYRALALLLAYFLGIHCFMTVELRYFLPLWPLLALLSCSLPAGLPPPEQRVAESPRSRAASWILKAALALVVALSLATESTLLSFRSSLARQGPGTVHQQLDDALRSHPDDAWLLGERAVGRLDQGDFAGAAEDFSREAALRPKDPSSSLQQARAEALMGKPGRLLAWLPPPAKFADFADLQLRIDADILKACAYLRLGRASEALERLKEARGFFETRNVLVRGPRGALETQTLEKLRGSDTGFVRYCQILQGGRPAEERRAMNEGLARLAPDSREVWLELARLAAQAGRRAEALKYLDRAASAREGGEDRRRLIPALYRDLKEYGRAEVLLEELIQRSPADAELRIDRAELAARRGRRADALEALAQAEERQPAAVEDQLRMGWLYWDLKDSPRAFAILREASRRRPDDAGLREQLAELEISTRAVASSSDTAPTRLLSARRYRDAKEYGRAEALLAALCAERPGDAGLWLERAELTAALGRIEPALEFLARAEALRPESEEQQLRVIALYRGLKDFRRAAAVLEALSRRRPGDEALLRSRAELYRASGDDGRLLAVLESLTAKRPQDAPAWLERAEVAGRLGRRADALRSLAQADRRPPETDEQRRRLIELNRTLKEFRRAFELNEPLVTSSPQDAGAWLTRAELSSALGDRRTALDSLARAEALHPENENHEDEQRRRIALGYQDLKEYGRALEIFARLTRQYPAAAAFRSDQALCAHLKGDDRAALDDLRAAIRLEPKFLPAYLTLGSIYEAGSRFQDAVRVYDEGLSSASPDAGPLRDVLLAARKSARSKAAR